MSGSGHIVARNVPIDFAVAQSLIQFGALMLGNDPHKSKICITWITDNGVRRQCVFYAGSLVDAVQNAGEGVSLLHFFTARHFELLLVAVAANTEDLFHVDNQQVLVFKHDEVVANHCNVKAGVGQLARIAIRGNVVKKRNDWKTHSRKSALDFDRQPAVDVFVGIDQSTELVVSLLHVMTSKSNGLLDAFARVRGRENLHNQLPDISAQSVQIEAP